MAKNTKKRGDETQVKIIELNNKSRKGTYIYVKTKGKPSRYYKYKGIPIDIYHNYYEERYKKGKPTKNIRKYEKEHLDKTYKVGKQTQQKAKTYVKKISKRPTINQAIEKGITQVTINNIHSATQKTINNKIKTLLQDLVLDKKLLELITKPENIKKIKHRFQYKAIIKNTDNKTITVMDKFNMTPNEAINEVKNKTKIGEELGEEGYTTGSGNKLKQEGWQEGIRSDTYNNTIKRIDLQIIFRKG